MTVSANAMQVLRKRYLSKDENGNVIEEPEDLFKRVAKHIAKAEEVNSKEMEEIFTKMMSNGEFLPNSPTLMNAGRELNQLAACFVLPIEDSMEGIFDTLKNSALIFKSGGGVGYSFSNLRPKDSNVGSTGGVASGPISFMKIFNESTEQIKQGGTRRGASMAVLKIDHPDILEFIKCKSDGTTLSNFNISVAITDEFVKCVKENTTYYLRDPRTDTPLKTVDANDVYTQLIENAWKTGDPGILFIDEINRHNPTPQLGPIVSVNPCGETPLLNMECCVLGSLNLAKFVPNKQIDYSNLKIAIRNAVRFLDNTIIVTTYPLPEIEQIMFGNRKIGLGVMGFADLLFQFGIPYNSEEGIDTAKAIMSFIQMEGHKASEQLAKERGAFPNFEGSIFTTPIRNATVTTIAPTGTLSIIANCSSGIEPLFALSFTRTVMDNDKLIEINPYFKQVAIENGFYSEELMEEISKTGSIQSIKGIPEKIKRVFVTSHDISPEWHVKMQAAFQRYTDNAVSKTVNLPHNATVEDVRNVYDLAYQLGCKGVTVYRDGSKTGQVLSFRTTEKDSEAVSVKERPDTLEGFTTRIMTGLGALYVTVTEDEGKPFEVFATIGKSGRSATAKTEAIGRLVSLALRSGVHVSKIIEQLKGIGGEHPVFQKDGLILSVPDAISRVLEARYGKGEKVKIYSMNSEKCPECGAPINFEEGCKTCHSCGYSKCS
jgi:ribonucleoside-diphosphate reductase alpha chain